MGDALGFRLEIREDSSMKSSQGVTTNLERKKKRQGYLLLKGQLGSTKPSSGRETIHTGAFVVKVIVSAGKKKKTILCSRRQCFLMGKRASRGPHCCVGMAAAQVPKLGLPSPPWDPRKRSAHTFQVQPELLRAQSSVAGAPGHRS